MLRHPGPRDPDRSKKIRNLENCRMMFHHASRFLCGKSHTSRKKSTPPVRQILYEVGKARRNPEDKKQYHQPRRRPQPAIQSDTDRGPDSNRGGEGDPQRAQPRELTPQSNLIVLHGHADKPDPSSLSYSILL